MKNLGIIAAILLMTFPLHSSDVVEFTREANSRLSGSRIVRNMSDVSVTQVSVLFQNTTKRTITRTERGVFGASRSGGGTVSAELTAYLVFSDGEPSAEEYQQVVDDFYVYLNKKLNEANIKTTSWEVFANSDLYEQYGGNDENDDIDEFRRRGNAWTIYNAYRGPRIIRYNPVNHNYNAPAVRGTTRMSRYCRDAKVNTLMMLNLVVDFASIYLDADVRSGTTSRTFSTTNWQNAEVKYSLEPQLRIASRENGGNSNFLFASNQRFEEIYNISDVFAPQKLNAEVSQDVDRIQKNSGLFRIYMGQRFDITPFVVETTKAEYFSGVKAALEKYADDLVHNIQSVRR